jgi:beta-phosphoglucomutase-like phosphatase (HAD superfamily)
MFLTGAKELGVPPEECFVVEDAVSGIQAAKAGGIAALGVSRAGDEQLPAAEPDVLVTSLDDVDLDAMAEGRLAAEGRLIAADHARRGNSHGRPARRRHPGGP